MNRDTVQHQVEYDQHELHVEYVDRPDVAVGEIRTLYWDGQFYVGAGSVILFGIENISDVPANNVSINVQLYIGPRLIISGLEIYVNGIGLSQNEFCIYDDSLLLLSCEYPELRAHEYLQFGIHNLAPTETATATPIVTINVSTTGETNTSNNSKTFSAPVLPLIETNYHVSLSNVPQYSFLDQHYSIDYSFSIPYSSADTYLPTHAVFLVNGFDVVNTSVSSRSSNNLDFTCSERYNWVYCKAISGYRKHPQGTFIEGTIEIVSTTSDRSFIGTFANTYFNGRPTPVNVINPRYDLIYNTIWNFFSATIAHPSPALAVMSWDKNTYALNHNPFIRIIEPDMKMDPNVIDSFSIHVWSDSDAGGIALTVTETDKNTGIFEGTVSLTTTDESSGHRLRVTGGDSIFAKYQDSTLSAGAVTNYLDITASAKISNMYIISPTFPISPTPFP
jgi:hypothetical protein